MIIKLSVGVVVFIICSYWPPRISCSAECCLAGREERGELAGYLALPRQPGCQHYKWCLAERTCSETGETGETRITSNTLAINTRTT